MSPRACAEAEAAARAILDAAARGCAARPFPFEHFESESAAMNDADLRVWRAAAIEQRDLLDGARQRAEDARNEAAAGLLSAVALYDQAARRHELAIGNYSRAADLCCIVGGESERRIKAARVSLAALGEK